MSDRVKVLSYGGGLNSFAMLLYSIEQGNPPHFCVFADTGSGDQEAWSNDGEWYGTYRHMVEYAIPICAQNGIQFKWITHQDSKVRGADSLLQYFEQIRIVPSNQSRYCTSSAKIERIEQWLLEAFGSSPIEVWVGFEGGEETRRDKDPHGAKTCGQAYPGGATSKPSRRSKPKIDRTTIFPLIGAGMCRCRCELFVRDRGLPVPRKSACWFCPFSKRGDWMRLAEQMPDQFARAAGLEENQKGGEKDKGKMYAFNSVQREGVQVFVPLWEDIHMPYRPKVETCPVCCRYPKATKAPGIDFLSEAEYVSYEEPLGPWVPGPWDPGLAPSTPLPKSQKPVNCEDLPGETLGAVADAVVEREEALVLSAENLTQQNALQWLGARLGVAVLDGTLEIPADHAREARELLGWFRRSTQIDRDLNPESEQDVMDLQGQLDAEIDLP
jgi:hypothetical protein